MNKDHRAKEPIMIHANESLSDINHINVYVWKNRTTNIFKTTILMVFIAATAFYGMGCSSNLGQNAKTFKDALLQDMILQNGIASPNYLNDSRYELTLCDVENITKISDSIVSADINATIENANYMTELILIAQYHEAPDDQDGKTASDPPQGYSFSVESSVTTPKKGIDYDQAFNLANCDAPLGSDGVSCEVSKTAEYGFWFADSVVSTTYSYKFNGTEWDFVNEDISHTITYKDINGEYAAKTGNLTDFSRFSISNFNPEKGTFTISYTIDKPHTGNFTYPIINGVLEATMDSQEIGDQTQKDGYSYYFEAKGSSDSGKGEASCQGYFTVSSDGESVIEIDGGGIDVTYTSALPRATYTETAKIAQGSMYRQ
jgi:hypothetical protein